MDWSVAGTQELLQKKSPSFHSNYDIKKSRLKILYTSEKHLFLFLQQVSMYPSLIKRLTSSLSLFSVWVMKIAVYTLVSNCLYKRL
ncbi:hypothetical protein [Wolbachia endosymbiont (group B) of Colias croceus]|uniref:hypothetical protein n=1 Tax=Wolbachia endosymbiont (group B) of Colias croceus TaxID=2953998 RepID=UPI002225F1E3|nr:hypothetical protein [Wolbachia endosymbiont (group B) of Colias croceus]